MNANKVILNGATILDLTQDGTREANVGVGVKFHKPSGQQSVGTAVLGGGGAGAPIEVATEAEMASILSSAQASDNGIIYKYVGASGIYTQNAYYQITIT